MKPPGCRSRPTKPRFSTGRLKKPCSKVVGRVCGSPRDRSRSHSGILGAAVLARRAVGLDVERTRTPHPRLRDRILSERERDEAARLPIPPDETSLLYWTLKEAVLKGRRTGLRQSTRSVELSIDYHERRAIANLDNGATWEAVFSASDGYLMSIAYEKR